jgi:hypothetical protein
MVLFQLNDYQTRVIDSLLEHELETQGLQFHKDFIKLNE